MSFVGLVDEVHALIQHQTRLYLVNYQTLSFDFFYQVGLVHFANFGMIALQEAINVEHMISIGMNQHHHLQGPSDHIIDDLVQVLSFTFFFKYTLAQGYASC